MIRDRIGKYKIESWIGGGAFADVFLGFDTITEQRYALKVSRQRQKDIEMLIHEAKLLASLEHPHIVRFYNADIIDGRLILVMEYVEGMSLRTLMEEKQIFPLQDAIQIMGQLLEGLDYAHRRGVLHRDLKPENILITEGGIVKITDFGLGVFFGGEKASLSVAGTPTYMPPEAWKGEYSPESDIWSAGAIFYEMLAGRPPFFDETLEGLRMKIKNGRPPRVPNVPPDVFSIIKKALNRSPEKRFHSASEFRAAIFNHLRNRELPFIQVELGRRRSKTLQGLTDEQVEAATIGKPAVLLIGGAGTGKTTTIAHRIAHLIKEDGVPAERIVAVTFTGKAAAKLKTRVEHLIGEGLTRQLWTGTFHMLGFRIISYSADRLGLPEDLMIIGREEALRVAMILSGNENANLVKGMLKEISLAKSRLIDPQQFASKARGKWGFEVARLYKAYEAYKFEHGLLDYDDMISMAIKLLKEHSDIRETFNERFDHLIVDEFQDINLAQYELIMYLILDSVGKLRTSIFVTGDDDQSIYGFRGASRKFIEKIRKDLPEIVELRLTHNFRSPPDIMKAAETLISHNKNRIPKVIIPIRKASEDKSLIFYAAADENDEAEYVAWKIMTEHENGFAYEDMAVIMRINSYSRAFEEVLAKKQIPYNLPFSGGFYERAEIREAVEFLKLLLDMADRSVLKSAFRRFFGFTSSEAADAFRNFNRTGRPTFSKKLPQKKIDILKAFWELVENRRNELEVISPADFLEEVFNLSGFLSEDNKNSSPSVEERKENIRELLNIAGSFGRGGIRNFLTHIEISRELGSQSQSSGGVQIMSIHSAKGLEFPIVFLVGMAEGIFPSNRSIVDPVQLEEERRLCFVALTRAQEKLFVTYPKKRFRRYQEPSRFLYEMYLKEK